MEVIEARPDKLSAAQIGDAEEEDGAVAKFAVPADAHKGNYTTYYQRCLGNQQSFRTRENIVERQQQIVNRGEVYGEMGEELVSFTGCYQGKICDHGMIHLDENAHIKAGCAIDLVLVHSHGCDIGKDTDAQKADQHNYQPERKLSGSVLFVIADSQIAKD